MSKIEDLIHGLDSYMAGEDGLDVRYVLNQRQIDSLIQIVRDELKPEWISVNARLPEKCNHSQHSASVTVYCERSKSQWSGCYDHEVACWVVSGDLCREIPGVTHWMPLPERPKL